MRIVLKGPVLVPLGSLRAGDTFQRGSDQNHIVYIKVWSRPGYESSGVCLSDGLVHHFPSDEYLVRKVSGQFQED